MAKPKVARATAARIEIVVVGENDDLQCDRGISSIQASKIIKAVTALALKASARYSHAQPGPRVDDTYSVDRSGV